MMRFAIAAGLAFAMSSSAVAAPEAPAFEAAPRVVEIVYLGKAYPELPPLSLVEHEVHEKGLWGARVALQEINRAGALAGARGVRSRW